MGHIKKIFKDSNIHQSNTRFETKNIHPIILLLFLNCLQSKKKQLIYFLTLLKGVDI